MLNNYNPTVVILCMTYNQKKYIRQCLDGFVMQNTDFPFAAIVVDDASTDNEQTVLWDFIKKELNSSTIQKEETDDYFKVVALHKTNRNCTFVFFFLKYNHYRKKAKKTYFMDWYNSTKYHAICEGDDYWTDSHKLQKQVDILESNPDFTMVCNRTKLYSEKQKRFIGENYCYNKSRDVKPKDVIYRTGLFISTCSVIYRKTIIDNIPDYWAKCKVHDYPLQIMCAMKGKIYYFNNTMSVYRVQNPKSWMGQQQWGKIDYGRLGIIKSQVNMFKGFANDFPQYKTVFNNKIANHINRNIPGEKPLQEEFLSYFKENIKRYTFIQKIDLWLIRNLHNRKMKYYYLRIIHNHYFQRIKAY